MILASGFAGQFDYAGGAVAILGGKTSPEYAHILHRAAIKGTEKAEEMIDMVDGHPVKQHQILIRPTAADMQPGRTVPGAAHPGQQLQRAKDVLITHRRQQRKQFGREANLSAFPGELHHF